MGSAKGDYMRIKISEHEYLEADRLLVIDGEQHRVCQPLDVAWLMSSGDEQPIQILAGDVVGCYIRDHHLGLIQQQLDELTFFIKDFPEFEHYLKNIERDRLIYCEECNKWFSGIEKMHDIEVMMSDFVEEEMRKHGHTSGFLCDNCYKQIEGTEDHWGN